MTAPWISALGLEEHHAERPDRRSSLDVAPTGAARGGLPLLDLDPNALEAAADAVLASAPFPIGDLAPPQVFAFSTDPRVLLVHRAGATLEACTGSVQERGPGEWIVDGRAGPAGVVLVEADRRFAVVVVEREARVYELARLGPEPAVPDNALLHLEPLLAATPVEPWLVERVKGLWSAESAYLKVAALGTLARLWAPQDRRAVLDRILAGELGPPERIRSWAGLLDPSLRAWLVRQASLDLGVGHALLDDIREAAIEAAPDAGRQALRAAVERRELVAAVHWVLGGGGGRVPELDEACEALDARARRSWSERPHPSGLEEVAWVGQLAAREPGAWWGTP